MAAATGPNLITSGLVFNIDSFKYNSFDLGQKVWPTNDSSNRTGNITGTTTFNTSLGAVFLDGNASISYGNFLPVPANSNVTVEAWVYPTATSGQRAIISLSTSISDWQFNLSYSLTGNFRWETQGGSLQDSATYPINNWYHVVGRVAAGTSTIWVNGVQTTSGSGGLSNNNTTHTFAIAKFTGGLTSFAGNIRAARVYNRALSDSEIQQNYRAFYGRTFEAVTFPTISTTQILSTATIYAQQFSTTSPISHAGGYKTVTYSVSPALPAGIALNVSTGTITGTPTALSSATVYTITATDAIGQTSSKTLNLTVAAAPLVTTLNIGSELTINTQTYTQLFPITATGGFGTYTYSISALPTSCGANFNTSTGLLTLNPSAALSSTLVTVTAQDQAGQTSSKSFNLTVVALLYAFSSFTFTNGTATGAIGPTSFASDSSYTGQTWYASYFSVANGIQSWTVPADGTYRITARGANGRPAFNTNFGTQGGQGIIVQADVFLTKGEVIKMLVGQGGLSTSANGGGGGGTFVVRTPYNTTASILVVAGGGGGRREASTGVGIGGASYATYGGYGTSSNVNSNNAVGTITVNGPTGIAGFTNPSGTSGGGTTLGFGGCEGDNSYGDGGGGFFGNGRDDDSTSTSTGTAFTDATNPGRGGITPDGSNGGFGGGGAGQGGNGGGGGGGYTGGNGGHTAGGGGSYVNASATNVSYSYDANVSQSAGSGLGSSVVHGYVTIQQLDLTTAAVTPSTTTITNRPSPTITFNVSLSPPNTGIYYYSVENVTGTFVNADFSDNSLSGSFAANSGAGSFTRQLAQSPVAAWQDQKQFRLAVRVGSVTGQVIGLSSIITVNSSSVVTATPSPATINEGSTVTITISTLNVPDGTSVYWTPNLVSSVSGSLRATDFSDSSLSGGQATVTGNSASFTRTWTNDTFTEGTEVFNFSIRRDSVLGAVVGTSSNITVTDTSTGTAEPAGYTPVISTTNLYSHWDFSRTTDAVNTSYTTSGTLFSGGLISTNFGAAVNTPSMTYFAGSTSYAMTVQQTVSGRKYIRFGTTIPSGTYPTQGQGSRLQSGGNAYHNITSSTVGYTVFAAFRITASTGGYMRPHRLRIEGFNNDYNGWMWFHTPTSAGGNDIDIITYSSSSNNIFPLTPAVPRAIITTTDVYVECVSVVGTTVTATHRNTSAGFTYGSYGPVSLAPTYGTVVDANRTYEIRDNFYPNGNGGIDYFEGGVYSAVLTQAEQLTLCQALYNKWTT